MFESRVGIHMGHVAFVYLNTLTFLHLIKAGLELIGFMSWILIPVGMERLIGS